MDTNDETEKFNGDDMSEEVRHDIVVKTMPVVLSRMISEKILDENLNYKKDELWIAVHKYLEPKGNLDNLRMVIKIDDDFCNFASKAVKEGSLNVAIVLIAIAIEHEFNHFYRELLESADLTTQHTTQAIKTVSLEGKINWFLFLSSGETLSEDLQKDLTEVIELRNALVHYKAIPFEINCDRTPWDDISYRIENFDQDHLLSLPNKLHNELETIREKKSGLYLKIKQMCRIMFEG